MQARLPMRSIIFPSPHAAIFTSCLFIQLLSTATASSSSSSAFNGSIQSPSVVAFASPASHRRQPYYHLSTPTINTNNHQNQFRSRLASRTTITRQHLFWSSSKQNNPIDATPSSNDSPTTTTSATMTSDEQQQQQDDTTTITNNLSTQLSNLDLSKIEKFAHENGDVLFGYIEKSQLESGNPNFGTFLDAGTGSHSLRWIASVLHRERLLKDMKQSGKLKQTNTAGNNDGVDPHVTMTSYTAITADETMRRNVFKEAESLGIAEKGDVIIGNWAHGVERSGDIEPITFNHDDDNTNTTNDKQSDNTNINDNDNKKKLLLEGKTFNTILADYLIGAIDGFSPYFQDMTFHRLTPHLSPGGRLYIIGLQPIPDRVPGDANIMCKITKIRDSCILLANHRCYREYPVDWIQRHVKRAGLAVVETRTYPIRYDHATMLRQINVGRSKLRLFPTRGMAEEMGKVLDKLEEESLEVTRRAVGGRITLGFDYVVVAERPRE